MSNERPSHGAKQKLQYDDADFHSSSWVLVHHEVRTASSSSGSSQASLISSAHFLDDALLEPLLEMIGVPLANVHTSSCGESPHELVGASDERNRVNLRWVGLFLRTCKIIHASRTSIMKKILHFASTLGDARSISRFLVHTRWTTGGGMHEAGCSALFGMAKKSNEPHGGWIETSVEDAEDELVRIAAWEGGAHAVIVSLKSANGAKVALPGCSFLKAAAEVPRLRGLLALNGAFCVLQQIVERSQDIDKEHVNSALQAELAMAALVQGTEPPVNDLLRAFQSKNNSYIEDALIQIQKWLPRSNTEAEVVVGLAIDAMKMHPGHAGLQMKGFKCLRDLDHDTRIAVAHAGGVSLAIDALAYFKSDAVEERADLHSAAISALLVMTGSSSYRVGGAGGGATKEVVSEVLVKGGLPHLVKSMRLHKFNASVQQQGCNLLLALAEADESSRLDMVRYGVREVVTSAIQRDVLCEMRISLQCARNLLRLLCDPTRGRQD